MARLLARASELDSACEAGAAVAELRAAAVEAGISARAFDAALAELHGAGQARVSDVPGNSRRRPRMWARVAGVAALISACALAVIQNWAPSGAAAPLAGPMVEEAFLLRCLAPGETAELIRPLLRHRANSVVYSPAHAPRVLTIRATPTQMQNVRTVLDRYAEAGSPACAPGAAPAATPRGASPLGSFDPASVTGRPQIV